MQQDMSFSSSNYYLHHTNNRARNRITTVKISTLILSGSSVGERRRALILRTSGPKPGWR